MRVVIETRAAPVEYAWSSDMREWLNQHGWWSAVLVWTDECNRVQGQTEQAARVKLIEYARQMHAALGELLASEVAPDGKECTYCGEVLAHRDSCPIVRGHRVRHNNTPCDGFLCLPEVNPSHYEEY